jgi:hypothetical protein
LRPFGLAAALVFTSGFGRQREKQRFEISIVIRVASSGFSLLHLCAHQFNPGWLIEIMARVASTSLVLSSETIMSKFPMIQN